MIMSTFRFIQEDTGVNGPDVPNATLIPPVTYYLTAKYAITMCTEIIIILIPNVIIVIQKVKFGK
jgi:hypothetical protein